MNNSFELRNSYELRRRLRNTLATARERLSVGDFAYFSPQLELKLRELDESIDGYERTLLAATVLSACGMPSFHSYNLGGMTLIPQMPSVRIGSSSNDASSFGLNFRTCPKVFYGLSGRLF